VEGKGKREGVGWEEKRERETRGKGGEY